MDVPTAARFLGLAEARPDREALVRAWRRFARANHPDRCPGDPAAAVRFAAGREAFEALLRVAPWDAPRGAAAPGRAGVLRGRAAARARPYAPQPVGGREWEA